MTFTTNRTVERGCGKAQRSAYFISNAWRVSNVLPRNHSRKFGFDKG